MLIYANFWQIVRCKLHVTLFYLFLLQFFLIGIVLGAVQQVIKALWAVLAGTVLEYQEYLEKREGPRVICMMILD